ncbi:unnamed protein product [Chrysodeixis includens]|uniref:CHK kinase-like domain-containing protein n=1 Tax=Chrysodeixis includens TaxID=689277 RepID=A0A9P0FUI2_CHRIL|nr:unnamed protein product [Chrysodeixis includens]
MSLDVHMSEPDEFNCAELHSSISEVAHSLGIKEFHYDVDYISGKRENYIANVFRVLIKGDGGKNINVIVKTLVNTERQVLFHKLHEREVLVYDNVINKYKDMQKVLYEHERLVLSDCYFWNMEKANEIIVLEDLKIKGFDVDDKVSKLEYLDFEQICAVMSELAKFHALSFVYEKQDPKKFSKVKLTFEDIVYQNHFLNNSKLRNYYFESFQMSLNQVKNLDAKRKLQRIESKLLDLLQMYTKSGDHNVLCHGDLWVNNMLFKKEGDQRSKIALIDFQAMRYANPVTDLLYFLFVCTDSIFRHEHLDQLKIIYYDSLKVFLTKFDIDVEKIYSRETFNKDIDEFVPYGLLIALIELRVVSIPHEEQVFSQGLRVDSVMNLTEAVEARTEDLEYLKHRVNDVVDEAVANGAVDKLLDKINV